MKAAFFDVDGLLVDSEKIYIKCWMQAGEECGYLVTRQMALNLRSLDSTLAAKYFYDTFFDESAYKKVRMKRKELMNEFTVQNFFEPKPGVKEVVEYVYTLGLKVYVVTSAPVDRARRFLESAGIGEYFDTIISTENVSRGKPYPDVYKLAAQSANVEPSECIAFEDSPNGLKSAHTAGCVTVMIPDQTDITGDIKEYVDYRFDSLLSVVGKLHLIAK